MAKTSHILTRFFSLAALIVLCMPAWSVNRERSDLSIWLVAQPMSQLKQMLAEHPRFMAQRVLVKAANNNNSNGLTDALITVLQVNLQKVADVSADTTELAASSAGRAGSVDSLVCQPGKSDYHLTVAAQPAGYRQAGVILQLLDNDSDRIVEQWRWHGSLSAPEREYIKLQSRRSPATGQLSSPWQPDQIVEAATALSRDLVCGLRPWIQHQTSLDWPAHPVQIDANLNDTLLTSQHYIAAYDELALTPGEGQFEIETRAIALSGGIWQLWITARPQVAGLPTIEAATYVLGAPPVTPEAVPVTTPRATHKTAAAQTATPAPVYLAPAEQHVSRPAAPRDALRVEILGVSKQVKPRRADLVLRLRLSNAAQRKLEYALRTSGGYFSGCRGSAVNYHHQTWGQASGSLAVGESSVATIRIEDVQHQPGPPAGRSACAGFGDLTAFSNYSSHGDRVTQYLRWDD